MALLALLIAGCSSSWLHASTLTVENLNDSGPGSLRYCITTAPSADTIAFLVTGTIYLTNGALHITNNLNIVGPGANRLSVNGNRKYRVFEIASNATVYISGLTIQAGQAPGGVDTYRCDWLAAHGGGGGGILNRGRLALTYCTVKDNRAGDASQYRGYCAPGYVPGFPSNGGDGGGIYNIGDFAAVGCTFSGNSAGRASHGSTGTTSGKHVYNFTLRGGDGGSGGGIYNLGIISLTNCTIAANAAGTGGNGSSAVNESWGYLYYQGSPGGNGGSGAGIFNNGPMTIVACTFGENLVGAPGVNSPYASSFALGGIGGGIYSLSQPSQALVFNTLAASSFAGSFTSLGHNLLTFPTVGFENAVNSDLVGSLDAPLNPLLGPLQDNGGPTPTMALLPGSPATDKGKNIPGLDTDQRGACFSRTCDNPTISNSTDGDGTDVGSFEVQQGECSPANRIMSLIALLPTLGLHHGLANSLSEKLQAAADALAKGNDQAFCVRLSAFMGEVEAQKSKKLSPDQAGLLQAEAACVSKVSGCQ